MSELMDMKPDLKDFCNYTGFKDAVMVEIGSYRGQSAEQFALSRRFKKIYCVDPWVTGYHDIDPASNSDMEAVEKDFDLRTSQYPQIEKIKLPSNEAVKLFENESVDLVYIDACHTYEAVKEDLSIWLPKIKKGGFISGHDWAYIYEGVTRAIIETIGQPDMVFIALSWIKKA
jgi:predicted O-methyltransferase YrrM